MIGKDRLKRFNRIFLTFYVSFFYPKYGIYKKIDKSYAIYKYAYKKLKNIHKEHVKKSKSQLQVYKIVLCAKFNNILFILLKSYWNVLKTDFVLIKINLWNKYCDVEESQFIVFSQA